MQKPNQSHFHPVSVIGRQYEVANIKNEVLYDEERRKQRFDW